MDPLAWLWLRRRDLLREFVTGPSLLVIGISSTINRWLYFSTITVVKDQPAEYLYGDGPLLLPANSEVIRGSSPAVSTEEQRSVMRDIL